MSNSAQVKISLCLDTPHRLCLRVLLSYFLTSHCSSLFSTATRIIDLTIKTAFVIAAEASDTTTKLAYQIKMEVAIMDITEKQFLLFQLTILDPANLLPELILSLKSDEFFGSIIQEEGLKLEY